MCWSKYPVISCYLSILSSILVSIRINQDTGATRHPGSVRSGEFLLIEGSTPPSPTSSSSPSSSATWQNQLIRLSTLLRLYCWSLSFRTQWEIWERLFSSGDWKDRAPTRKDSRRDILHFGTTTTLSWTFSSWLDSS